MFDEKLTRRGFLKIVGSSALGFALWQLGFFRFFGHNSNGQGQLALKDIFSGVNYNAAAQPATQIGWALFRDKIVLNSQFLEDMAAEIAAKRAEIPDESILLLAARDFKFDSPSYTFRFSPSSFGGHTYHLMIIADSLEANAGTIDASGESLVNEGLGPNPGDPGLQGKNGMDVTLLCKDLLGSISIVSNGGKGGKGRDGANGAPGRIIDTDPCGPGEEVDGCEPPDIEVPQNGQDGGNGGNGGNSGRINVVFVNGQVSEESIVALAGGPGDPGQGGNPGPPLTYRNNTYRASPGRPGNPGQSGTPFQRSIETLDEEMFWNHIRSTMGNSFAQQWANYRLNVGSYYYRIYRPDDVDFENLVIGEFRSVLSLTPQNQDALRLINQITANQNILGMTYDYDIFPDFPAYEETVRDYIPIITNYFDFVIQMLAEARNTAIDEDNLRLAIQSAERNRTTLDLEKQRADLGLALAQQEFDLANQRAENNRALIEARQGELESSSISIFDFVTTAAAIAAAIYSFGATAVATYKAIAAAPGLFKAVGTTIGDSGLIGLIDWKKGEIKPEFNNLVGGLKDILTRGKELISRAEVLRDIAQNVPDLKIRELLLQSAEIAFAQNTAATRKRQAEIEVEIVDIKLSNLNADIEETRGQAQLLQGEVASLGEVANSYLKIARNYADLLMRLIFLSARALDIYTLSSRAKELSYAYGYLHPDMETTAFERLRRADTSGIILLMNTYKRTVTEMGQQLSYAHQYLSYQFLPGWGEDIIFRIEDSAEKIREFKDTKQYRFSISLEGDEPANAFESKVEAVTVGLIGARSRVNNIACNIEHSGEWSTRRYQNGEIVKLTGSPKRSSREQASITQEQFDARLTSDVDRLPDNFWGRGPSTTWMLYLEPERMERDQVDLSGLTEIRIAIHYRAIFQSA